MNPPISRRTTSLPGLIMIGMLVIMCLGGGAGWSDDAPAVAKYKQAVLIRFEGEITPLSEHSFYRRLDESRKFRPDLLVVEIDSPGGWVDSSLKLAERRGPRRRAPGNRCIVPRLG